MLIPKQILDISEPIERIYQQTTDELLINIAHHFNISGWERTRYWEIKKLSEMGQLTKESAAIIAKNTQLLPEEIEKAFLQVSEKACKDIDPQLKEAAAKGVLQGVETDATTSVLMRQLTQSYVDQAVDTMNMVNTTMLESTRQAYQRGIAIAVSDAALAEAGQALEVAAYQVVTGLETRTHAIRKAMNALASTGITGFYDKAGRRWSAEAYSAMVVRTTAHNAYVQGIKTRQQEFGGGDIFQVSSHPAARPLCYPYQGKFYSWSGSGTWTDGAGHKHEYENISVTSYGEPAGLFGINCGHHPIPMIDGFSYPQDYDIPSEAENAKEYEESQKQRAYEREIREAKRDLEIAKATGDTEAIKAAEQKVAQKQANMRAFTKETGRPRRYDREKIAGTKDIEGYRGYRAQFGSDTPLDKTPKTPKTEKVHVSDTILNSMGDEASDFMGVLKKAPASIKALYTRLSDGLKSCVQSNGRGFYRPSTKEIQYDLGKGIAKWRTFAHEYGHFADAVLPLDLYTADEYTALNNLLFSRKKAVASASDEFLLALRADKAYNKGYKTDKALRKIIRDDLLAHKEETAGIQDMFDGFFGTQDSKDDTFALPWGHGNKYYNRLYTGWVKNRYWNRTSEVKQFYADRGFDVSNQSKVKAITRDYDTASELWANISSAMTTSPDTLAYYEKYAPNSLKVYKQMIERFANGTN